MFVRFQGREDIEPENRANFWIAFEMFVQEGAFLVNDYIKARILFAKHQGAG